MCFRFPVVLASQPKSPLTNVQHTLEWFFHVFSGIKVSKFNSRSWWSERPLEPPARDRDGLHH
jgi:hypothetical protein